LIYSNRDTDNVFYYKAVEFTAAGLISFSCSYPTLNKNRPSFLVIEIPDGIFIIHIYYGASANSFEFLKITIPTISTCNIFQLQPLGDNDVNYTFTTHILLSPMTNFSFRYLALGQYISTAGSSTSIDCFI
jgi:hypothetical protein